MSIPYTTKINERAFGQAIVNENHTIGIVGIATYASSQISLVEVPQGPGPAVSITGTGGPYTEILTGTPTGGQFLVNYTTGVITFSSTQNGNVVSVSYTGLGSEISAQDVNEVQEPLNSIMSFSLTYNPPYTSAIANWSLNTGLAVTTLNGLTDAVTLSAGSNITITPVGNSLVIASTGGGGGTPGGTSGSVQFNSSGTFLGDATHFYWDSTNYHLGLDTSAPISTLDVNGSFATAIRTITSSATVLATDHTILANATSGVVDVTLPVASTVARRTYDIKKIDSSANLVTVVASGSDTIDGSATFPMSVQWQSVTVQSNGTAWFII